MQKETWIEGYLSVSFLKLSNIAISANSWWNFIKQSLPSNSMTLITYVYHFTSPKKEQKPLRYCVLMAFSEFGRQRPQKRKDSGLVRICGTSTHGGGVTNLGTLWKWIFPELWRFFWNYSGQPFGLLAPGRPSGPAPHLLQAWELLTKIVAVQLWSPDGLYFNYKTRIQLAKNLLCLNCISFCVGTWFIWTYLPCSPSIFFFQCHQYYSAFSQDIRDETMHSTL